MFRIYCYKDQSKWPEFLPFFETAINENYHDTTEYTPAELDSGLKPERFWHDYFHTPKTSNLPLPVQCKNQLVKERIVAKGRKRAERFNTSHKPVSYTHLDVYKRQEAVTAVKTTDVKPSTVAEGGVLLIPELFAGNPRCRRNHRR